MTPIVPFMKFTDPVSNFDLIFDDCVDTGDLCMAVEIVDSTALSDFGIQGPPANIKAKFMLVTALPEILKKIIEGKAHKGGVTFRMLDPEGNPIASRRFRVKSASSKIKMSASDGYRRTRKPDPRSDALYEQSEMFEKWTMRQSAEIRDLLSHIASSGATVPTVEVLFIEESNGV